MNGPVAIIRDAAARRGALVRYAYAHDRYAAMHHRLAMLGLRIEAAGAEEFARIARRAYLAEQHDPRPEGLRDG